MRLVGIVANTRLEVNVPKTTEQEMDFHGASGIGGPLTEEAHITPLQLFWKCTMPALGIRNREHLNLKQLIVFTG